MAVFDGWDKVDFERIGEIITMSCRVDENIRVRSGWLEPLGQVLNRVDYPKLYLLWSTSPDAEFRKLIIDGERFRMPDWRGIFFRQYGDNGTHVAGVPGTIKQDQVGSHRHYSSYGKNGLSGNGMVANVLENYPVGGGGREPRLLGRRRYVYQR